MRTIRQAIDDLEGYPWPAPLQLHRGPLHASSGPAAYECVTADGRRNAGTYWLRSTFGLTSDSMFRAHVADRLAFALGLGPQPAVVDPQPAHSSDVGPVCRVPHGFRTMNAARGDLGPMRDTFTGVEDRHDGSTRATVEVAVPPLGHALLNAFYSWVGEWSMAPLPDCACTRPESGLSVLYGPAGVFVSIPRNMLEDLDETPELVDVTIPGASADAWRDHWPLACATVATITDEDLAIAVSGMPFDHLGWQVTAEERVALAERLSARRDALPSLCTS
jgi:hypothetical protein